MIEIILSVISILVTLIGFYVIFFQIKSRAKMQLQAPLLLQCPNTGYHTKTVMKLVQGKRKYITRL